MVKSEIQTVIKRYIAVLKAAGIDVDKTYLYGSCARGENTEHSDIDLLLVSDYFDTDDDKILSSPWLYTVKVDPRIEPLAISSRRFLSDESSPLLGIIKREGIEIM